MAELTARLALYGAVDRAVVEGVLDPAEVSEHMPTYAGSVGPGPPATGWYDRLSTLAAPRGSRGAFDPPDVARALETLAGDSQLDALEAAHRLRAVFLARRLLGPPGPGRDDFPDDDYRSSLVGVTAFRPAGREAEAGAMLPPDEAAAELAAMIDDRGRFGGPTALADLAAEAVGAGVLHPVLGPLIAIGCDESTAWYDVAGSDDTDVAGVVTSEVVTTMPQRTVDELRLAFHPGRWPECMPSFWGSMTPVAPPPPDDPAPGKDPGTSTFFYRESVGDQANDAEWFHPVLEFWYEPRSVGPLGAQTVDGFAIRYGIADPTPDGEPQDPRILLDDGDLTVRTRAAGGGSMSLRVTTTKMLALVEPALAAGVAVFACAAGWADQTKALLSGCLAQPDV